MLAQEKPKIARLGSIPRMPEEIPSPRKELDGADDRQVRDCGWGGRLLGESVGGREEGVEEIEGG